MGCGGRSRGAADRPALRGRHCPRRRRGSGPRVDSPRGPDGEACRRGGAAARHSAGRRPRSLAVAEHWGYERFQYGITSRFDLVDLPDPDLSDGLGLETCPTVPYDDDEAVLAMLDVAQTNPERDAGLFVTPAMLRDFSGKGTPVGRLARIDGAPVGMIHGSVHGDQLHIHYACVHRDFRGRGVALAMKQQLHLDAMQAGATQLLTTNEAADTAIRTLNARLGYERLFGEYRLQRGL